MAQSDEASWSDRLRGAWNQRVEESRARFRELLDRVANQTREFEWDLGNLPFGKGAVRVTVKTLQ